MFGAPNSYWVWSGDSTSPAEQNGSGYSYNGAMATTDGGLTWINTFANQNSISIEAVPEPSTYALLALSAVGLGGYVLRRRRR